MGRNGPAIYSSDDTNILTIGYSSGELTANGPGSTNIRVSYSGAPYRWGKTATVCNQYFLKSSHSYMTSASNVEGATVKATEFNGNIEQMWVFVYQGEGYYFIRDRKSGNYLTAPNNNLEGSVVSQRLTSDLYLDRQLWKIVYRNSTTGSYRLQAKARETDGSNLYLGYIISFLIKLGLPFYFITFFAYVKYFCAYIFNFTTYLCEISKKVTSLAFYTKHFFIPLFYFEYS